MITSLLIWTTLWVGVISAADPPKKCYSNLELRLKSDVGNAGWNGLGKGFLGIFEPSALTDTHYDILRKMVKTHNYKEIVSLIFSMGGLIFLVVVSILMMLCFCAAPISYCCFNCICKKKCKPKSNPKILYTGLVCNSLSMLTMFLGVLFCILSIASITGGVSHLGKTVEPLGDKVTGLVEKLLMELECGSDKTMSAFASHIAKACTKFADILDNVPGLGDVMKINFTTYKTKIAGFVTKHDKIDGRIKTTEQKLIELALPSQSYLTEATKALSKMKSKMDSAASILDPLEVKQNKAKGVKEDLKDKVFGMVNGSLAAAGGTPSFGSAQKNKMHKQLEPLMKKLKEPIKSGTDSISYYAKKADDYTWYLYFLLFVLVPCLPAFGSAAWSTYMGARLVQKKKALPREMKWLLIPLVVGLSLAFLPLLTSTVFMAVSGVSNLACGTLFHKQFDFVPKVMHVFDVNPVLVNEGPFILNITATLDECKKKKTLFHALGLGNVLSETWVKDKIFDKDQQKTNLVQKIADTSLDLPVAGDWVAIDEMIAEMEAQRKVAFEQINSLAETTVPTGPSPTLPNGKLGDLQEVKDVVKDMTDFSDEVDKFVKDCDNEIKIAKNAQENVAKDALKNSISPLIDGSFDAINSTYMGVRKTMLDDSSNCDFIFTFVDSIGELVCDQSLGGLNGIYASIGLAALSFFSATTGTVMIWHTLRAGMGWQEAGSSGNKKNGAKGGEESSNLLPDGKNEKGAQPTPSSSDPTPPGLQDGKPVSVQAVPTDPAAAGEKTNPSLLPNDALPGGAPQSSDPTPR